MSLKRRLSSFSRSKKSVMVGEKEGTLPVYHHHEQGSSISDPSVITEEEARHTTRRDKGAATYGGDVQQPVSSDRSSWPSTSPPTISASDKQGGIPRAGTGHRHGQQSSGDSRVMPNSLHKSPLEVHQQKLGNRESGGLLRLNGSQGWTAPRWQEGIDRPEADDQNGSVDCERRHSFPSRTPSVASAGQVQASGAYNSSVMDRPPWYRHSVDGPSTGFGQVGTRHQQNPTTPSERSGGTLGNSSQFTDEELQQLRSEQRKDSSRRRSNLRGDSGDQQSSHRSKTDSGSAPSNANQEWIQLELDRLKTEFQFKNQIASMLRTTLADLKTQRGAAAYPPVGHPVGSPPGAMPVPPMASAIPVPSGVMLQGAVPGQTGSVPSSGIPLPAVGMHHHGSPMRDSAASQNSLQMHGGSPHTGIQPGGAGFSHPNMPAPGPGRPETSIPVPGMGVFGGPLGMQNPWHGREYPGSRTGISPGGRDGAHPLLSPSTSARELAVAKMELEKKNKHIGQLLAEISTLETQIKVLSEAVEEERHDNAELSQENAILRGQVERLTSASEKLLRGMTAIRAV